MKYIFLDLEFNQPMGWKNSRLGFEIMEIGAVKTDENLNIIDTFRVYVKNTVYKKINRHVKKITGITLEDLQGGMTFTKAYKTFREWIGNEEFKVLAYSDSDEIVLNANLNYYNLLDKGFDKIIDVQNEIMTIMNMSRQPSLKDLCAIYDIEIDESKVHKALFDTIILAEAYRKFRLSSYTIVEMRNRVDEKYKDLFDLTLKITYEEAKGLDKRKYKVVCPECKGQLKKQEIYYHCKKGTIDAYAMCKKCNKEVGMIFRFRRDIVTNEINMCKDSYMNKVFKENNKYKTIK